MMRTIARRLWNQYRRDRYVRLLTRNMRGGIWNLDDGYVEDGIFYIRGWAFTPSMNHEKSAFTVNDVEVTDIHYPSEVDREDLEQIFWYIPGARFSGFNGMIDLRSSEELKGDELVIKFVDKRTLEPYNPRQNYFYKLDTTQWAYPEGHRRLKVHGSDHLGSFLIEGFTTYKKIKLAVSEVTGKTFEDFPDILDWGCGCGRMTRYFDRLDRARITGIDIDEDNVNWCQNHLPFGTFHAVSLSPPTQIDGESFDLLIGISIFTHLKEADQYAWLEELSRLAKPDAYLMMTVHSLNTAGRSRTDHNTYAALKKNGFLDYGHNPNLDSFLEGDDYYRNTLHTHQYIHQNWSRYFKILKIIPGYIGNHQDLVIMQKR